jgi:negative regulator of sigma E activity
MSDKSNQQISDLMDGELEINASKFLLKRMASDDALKHTWDNYHLIKSCLQKEKQEPLVIDIAMRVSEELGMPKNKINVAKPVVNRWLKPIMGIGIAASVALMSVFMLQNQQIEGISPAVQTNIAQTSAFKPIKTNISANVATSGKTIVPPPSLSRFPSLSAQKTNYYSQGNSKNINMPYMILISQPENQQNLSPMRIKNISD